VGARKSFRFRGAEERMMSWKWWDVRWRGRRSCILRWERIISKSSGVRRTVEAAERLSGVGLGWLWLRRFWVVGVSSSVVEEKRRRIDLRRHIVFRIFVGMRVIIDT